MTPQNMGRCRAGIGSGLWDESAAFHVGCPQSTGRGRGFPIEELTLRRLCLKPRPLAVGVESPGNPSMKAASALSFSLKIASVPQLFSL
jgi:hypothetical protein